MLTLYTNGEAVPLHIDDYCIKELASGLDELVFSLSIWDEEYLLIQEEASIREQSDGKSANYLVKAIDGGVETATVKCQIDLDEWKSTFSLHYDSGSNKVVTIVNAVKPTGWSVVDSSGIDYRRTIRLDGVTPFEVLDKCRSTFNGVTFRFDNVKKVVTLLNMENGQNLGAFATRDLNLTRNDYKGKSTGFATRLYAYGKDGLSFASINGGKAYVENHDYSDRVICAYWTDERYTVAANLLADAQAKIDEMAMPQRSYDCDVVDLAKTNPEKYSELDFQLFTVIGLIDQTRSKTKIDHQIVQLWRYPYHPDRNKVVLSTVAPRIQSQVTQIIQSITNVNSDWNEQQAAYYDSLTAAMLGAKGGSVRLLDTDDDGEPDTLYIADSKDPAMATKVWRFNYLGWAASTNGYNGPFSMGATFDDGGTLFANVLRVMYINASNITTGTLSADRIAANSIAVSKLTGTISNSGWQLDLTNGTFTIGTISASNITAGTLDASTITVTNLNATNITTGTLNVARIADNSLANAKLVDNTVTGGKIAFSTITGGSYGNLSSSTITTDNTVSGINTNLGYAANYGTATAYSGSSGPTYFNCYQINCSTMVFNGAGISLRWSDTLGHYYLGSGGEG